jgi:DNA-binding NarL/FixJ family response regulator
VIRVLVADDQALVRAGFGVLIESADDLDVVGLAANGVEAVELTQQTRPDVVLMDIRMPVMDGLQATARILQAPDAGTVRVLMLTTFDLDEYVFGALKAGASGFLLKDTPPADLLAGVRIVAAGDALLSPSVTRHLIEEFVRRPKAAPQVPPSLDGLTEREAQVLTLVARGLSNGEIAQRLFVSPATAKTHVGRLLMKLNVRDRAQLIIVAYETGLISAQPPPGSRGPDG